MGATILVATNQCARHVQIVLQKGITLLSATTFRNLQQPIWWKTGSIRGW